MSDEQIDRELEFIEQTVDAFVDCVSKAARPGWDAYIRTIWDGAWNVHAAVEINYHDVEIFGHNFEYIVYMCLSDRFGAPNEREERWVWKNEQPKALARTDLFYLHGDLYVHGMSIYVKVLHDTKQIAVYFTST